MQLHSATLQPTTKQQHDNSNNNHTSSERNRISPQSPTSLSRAATRAASRQAKCSKCASSGRPRLVVIPNARAGLAEQLADVAYEKGHLNAERFTSAFIITRCEPPPSPPRCLLLLRRPPTSLAEFALVCVFIFLWRP